MPSAAPSIAQTVPPRGAGTARITGALGRRRSQFSTKSESAPMALNIRVKCSKARPSATAARRASAPASAVVARPLLASKPPPSSAVTSRIGPVFAPVKTRITSATSSALPRLGTSGWFMSLITAVVGQPAAVAVLLSAWANARACVSSFMNAPEPTLTSSTKPSSPAASFFDRIDAVIRSSESTVEVTSRTA